MAVNHREDSIQLIRDTEGINNKDRVRILSPDADPPEEVTDVTKHALYMDMKNEPGDDEPYEYEFACCTGRRFIPQRAGDANKLEGKTSAEVKAMFADGRAVFAGSGKSVALDAEGDRVHSITVNGFTVQNGADITSKTNLLKPAENSNTGITVKKNSDGSVRVSGTATSRSWPRLGNIVIPTSEIYGDVTISFKSAVDRNIVFKLGDGTEHVIAKGKTSITANIPSDAVSGIHVFLVVPEGESIDQTYYVMVNKGTTAAPFVPYIEGTGAPTPVNSRAITNGGLKLVEVVFNGTENWGQDSSSLNAGYLFSRIPAAASSSHYAISNILGFNFQYGGNGVFAAGNHLYFGAAFGKQYTVDTWKAMLAARYAAGNPVIAWYRPADESDATGIYIPVIGTGGEYSAKCVKITDHLCAGDMFITKVKIECDKKIVVDGENVKVVDGGPTYFNIGISNNGGIAGSRVYKSYGGGVYNSGANLQLNRADFGVYGDTPEDFNNYCKNNPLILWYCSAKYTKENFSEVALEQHLQGQRVLNGVDESWTKASDAGAYYSNFKGKPSGKIISEYLPYATATETKGGKTGIGIGGLGGIQLRLPNGENPTEYFPENPLLIVYELTSTIVYAHEPVDFEFSPGEDGVFTITGEADGTLDVYYKALQDGGDADKLGGKLPEYYAAAANALGQYTHTKSGTVHELTGTGDNIRFVATADFAAGDTVKVNGTTCTASTMSGDALWAGFFKSGAVVVCYRTGNALNFSGGGLAAAEAAKITPENLKTGVSVTVNGKTVAGTFTADGTAAAGDMLLGKTGYVKGQKVTGTIPSKAAASYKPGTSAQTIKAVQYLSGDQTIEGDAALIAANIKYGASIFDVDGSFTSDANAVAADILTGKIGYVKGQKVTGSMPNRGAVSQSLAINGTYTIPAGYHNGSGKVTQSITTKGAASYRPGTSAQTIAAGQYLSGAQTIQGDGNLVAGNIRSGVSIFGVAGTLKYQISHPEVLAFNLDAPSPHPTPVRTTVSAPASGNYRIQVRYSGHDSDRAGKFNVKIGKNGSWTINEYDDYDLSGTWTQDYYCNAGDQLMIEIGGYSPKASAYVIMYLNGQNAV